LRSAPTCASAAGVDWIGGAPFEPPGPQTREQEVVTGAVALIAAVLVVVGWL
jgi:hypothetical protein